MCLLGLAIDQSRRFPLVVAANRDEFFARPAARLAWWTPAGGGPAILSGRDLEAGGTWMGLTAQGRLAMLTNVRSRVRPDPEAPSRGRIVPDWLGARESSDRFWMRTALSGHNGFNLIAADFLQGSCFWASNQAAHPVRLGRGLYGLSNAGLDTPWPKVDALKARMQAALDGADSTDELCARLFAALADRHPAPAEQLPDTGIGAEREQWLSPAFIRSPDGSYGTRCSTLIVTERVGRHALTHVLERSFSATGGVALLRRSLLRHWPPRYSDGEGARSSAEAGSVSETEEAAEAAAAPAVKRTRVRSLLKPETPPRRR